MTLICKYCGNPTTEHAYECIGDNARGNSQPLWSCTGAYDKQAFAELIAVFTANGEPFGFVLRWGYRDGRQFQEFHPTQDAAMQSGHDWVLGCDWMEAPTAVRAMYPSRESYISGTL